MKKYGLNKIFVEGKSDKLFIDHLLKAYFDIDDNEIVIDTKGKDKLSTQPDLINIRRIEEKAKNIIIFDTDSDNNQQKGGRQERIKEYNSIASSLRTEFEIFLLPFNNETEGILEDLLNECLKKEFSFFDECWTSMLECMKAKDFENLNIPAKKAFVYSKIDLFKHHRTNKWDYKSSSVYDYTDKGIWDIEIEKNESLKSLVKFIEENLLD